LAVTENEVSATVTSVITSTFDFRQQHNRILDALPTWLIRVKYRGIDHGIATSRREISEATRVHVVSAGWLC